MRYTYLFKPRFAVLVMDGKKTQTIRPPRADGKTPALNDLADLRTWLGKPYRSKQSKLSLGRIWRVRKIQIGELGVRIWNGKRASSEKHLDSFARLDGFRDWPDMLAFFKETHGEKVFIGNLIEWEILA